MGIYFDGLPVASQNGDALSGNGVIAFTTNAPQSVFFWFKPDDFASERIYFSCRYTLSNSWQIRMGTDTSGRGVYFAQKFDTLGRYAVTSNVAVLGEWNLLVCIQNSHSNRVVVLNGDWDSRGTNTTSQTTTALNRFSFGADVRGQDNFASSWGRAAGHMSDFCVADYSIPSTHISEIYKGRLAQAFQGRDSVTHRYPMRGNYIPNVLDVAPNAIHATYLIQASSPVRGESVVQRNYFMAGCG